VIKASMSYKLPPDLEHFALEHAVYLLNRYPNNHTFPTSSWEIFSGEKFNMKYIHLLPFGSVAIFFQGNDLRTKEHPYRGEYGIFVGKHANMPTSLRVFLPSRNEIVDRSNNYQLLSSPPVEWNYESNPYRSIKSKSKKVKISINNDTNDATLTVINDDEVLKIDKIDANVEEDAISSSNIEDNEIVEQDVGDLSKVVSVDKMSVISQSEMKIDNSQPILDNVTNFENINEHYEGIDGKSGRTGNTRYELRSRGTRKAFITATQLFDPGGFKSYELKDELNENYYNSSLILKTYVKQALSTSNPNRESAEISIRKELSQMVDLKVFQPVRFQDIPYGDRNKIISSIMFIKDKFKTDGTYDKTKARLAARGDQMENSFDEIFTSPTANLISLFILLSISANNSCTIRTIDVPGAYLHASLSEEDVVYMTIPADCEDIYCDIIKREKKDIMHNGKIYVKLKKALYGLKQSSKLWYEVLKSDLLSQGFRVTNSDPCLFAKNISGKFCYALIYVDDIFINSTDTSLVDSLQQYMEKQYGKVSFQDGNKISFLALSIEISDEGKFIKINQNFYIEKLIEHVENDIIKEALVESKYPSSERLFSSSETDDKSCNKDHYLSILMSLMFAAIRTRPDIIKEVTFLATRVSSPTLSDWNKLMKVMGYLKAYPHHKIYFKYNDCNLVELYTDASNNCHSNTSGHTGIVGKVFGNVVFWKSSKQRIVVISSTEAELVALDEGATYAVWIMELLDELMLQYKAPVLIYQDNLSTMTMAKSGKGQFKRTKHIANRYFWVKQFIDSDEIQLKYVPTNSMIADILTKPLFGEKYYDMVRSISNEN
jgi:hypothetical protein